MPDSVVLQPPENLSDTDKELLSVAIGCAKVLNSLSSSPKIKAELRRHGAVFLIARFLKSSTTELIVPTMGAVQQCADLVGRRRVSSHLRPSSRVSLTKGPSSSSSFSFRKISDWRSSG